MHLNSTQKKVLALCHNGEYEKAWLYWKMMGYSYGIFLGEVSASEFITGDALAQAIGLTAGISQYNDVSWMKFLLNNELIYVPLKTLRHSISWEAIYQAGAVYGTSDYGSNPSGGDRLQDAKVTIGDNSYTVTLLKRANDGIDVVPNSNGYDIESKNTVFSEWDKLLIPVHDGLCDDIITLPASKMPFNQWTSYNDEDLLMHFQCGNGSYCWTQETHSNDAAIRLGGGYSYISNIVYSESNTEYENMGWRPALRRKVF